MPAYPLRDWLMPPLNSAPEERPVVRYNRTHKSTRRFVECSIGIVKERFPVLNHMRVDPEMAGKVFLACVALHNVACKVAREENDYVLQQNALLAEEEEENVPEFDEDADRNEGLHRQNEILRSFQY